MNHPQKLMKLNSFKNWMNYEANMMIVYGRILVLILKFCEFILNFIYLF